MKTKIYFLKNKLTPWKISIQYTTLVSLIRIVASMFDGGIDMVIALCGLTKVFYSVNVNILINKLNFCNIRMLNLLFFTFWIYNSRWVPESSILNPILLHIYINGLTYYWWKFTSNTFWWRNFEIVMFSWVKISYCLSKLVFFK